MLPILLLVTLLTSTLYYCKYSLLSNSTFTSYDLITTALAITNLPASTPTTATLPNMTADKSSRALSTLSPVPDVLRTPSSTIPSTETRNMSETRAEAKERLKLDVNRLLDKDRMVLHEVRKRTQSAWSAVDLKPDVLEQKLVSAALDKLTQRRAAKQDISAVYPASKDYVPPAVHGKSARGDQKKQELIERQLDMSFGVRGRVQRNEESDDDEPNPYLKKEEDQDTSAVENSALRGISPEISSTKRKTPAQRDFGVIGKSERISSAASKQRSTKTRMRQPSSDAEPEENEDYKSDSEDSSSSSPSPDNESEEEEEEPYVPLAAVLRGQTRPEDIIPYVPSKETLRVQRLAAIRRRIQLAKKTDNGVRAVLRGQMEKKSDDDDANVKRAWVAGKGFVSKKRVRGTEGGEDRGQEQKKNKKAKVQS